MFALIRTELLAGSEPQNAVSFCGYGPTASILLHWAKIRATEWMAEAHSSADNIIEMVVKEDGEGVSVYLREKISTHFPFYKEVDSWRASWKICPLQD